MDFLCFYFPLFCIHWLMGDNMLRFVMDIYRDELNYLHEKKNNRRPF